MVEDDSIEYFERRAEEERTAASAARSAAARKAHLEMADRYAASAKARRGRPTSRSATV
jgi:hypothetical protein